MTYGTREEWLNAAIHRIQGKLFEPLELRLPEKLRASCGFCTGKAIGICVKPECADDGATHIFIDPSKNEPLEIISILVHEMVHAHCFCEGLDCGHKGKFKKIIRELGLAGKPTATFLEPGSELEASCKGIAADLGEYPHAPVRKIKKETKPHAWISFVSTSDEEFIVRANKHTVKEKGPPRDHNGEPMVPKNAEDMEDEDEPSHE